MPGIEITESLQTNSGLKKIRITLRNSAGKESCGAFVPAAYFQFLPSFYQDSSDVVIIEGDNFLRA